MTVSHIFFGIFSFIALLFAGAMLTRKSALDGAVCLVVCFLSFAGLYAMLDAPFVAVMQVLVYAGAIMMLIIFVIMTAKSSNDNRAVKKPVVLGGIVATAIMAICMGLFFTVFHSGALVASAPGRFLPGTVERVGMLLFTKHVLNFEMVSLLLLVALVGGLVLGKKRMPS